MNMRHKKKGTVRCPCMFFQKLLIIAVDQQQPMLYQPRYR